jgi:hydrogenase expression/formation protein HypE
MRLREAAIPIRPEVAAACELLGLDPLYIANEGKLVCICPQQDATPLLEIMRAHPLGKRAALIGEVIEDASGLVQMETEFGGSRVVDWLVGEQLPRIC